MTSTKSFAILLDQTSHPGNIGASARAMKTMGLFDLRLINPSKPHQNETWAMASGADDIISNASHHQSIQEASLDLDLLIGLSARRRNGIAPLQSTSLHTFLNAHPQHNKVGFLFGNEKSGLDTPSLSLCHAHMIIPTNPDFSSLNLAASVQVICYLCHTHTGVRKPSGIIEKNSDTASLPASIGSIQALSDKLLQLYQRSKAPNTPSSLTPHDLTQMLMAQHLSRKHSDIAHGVLKSILRKMNTQ